MYTISENKNIKEMKQYILRPYLLISTDNVRARSNATFLVQPWPAQVWVDHWYK